MSSTAIAGTIRLIAIILISNNKHTAMNLRNEEKTMANMAHTLTSFPAMYNGAKELYFSRSDHRKKLMSGNNASGALHKMDEKK
jgi:hypothetical protein